MNESDKDSGLKTPDAPRPLEIFYSYAHEDESFRLELEKHLSLMRRNGEIAGWHDRNISAGTDWKDSINEHLESAHIILLLVSADFLASDYCYEIEMKRALERQNEGQARVIPVILRNCDWSSAPFSRLQALPKGAKPIRNWNDPDEAYQHVVAGIREAVSQIKGVHVTGPSKGDYYSPGVNSGLLRLSRFTVPDRKKLKVIVPAGLLILAILFVLIISLHTPVIPGGAHKNDNSQTENDGIPRPPVDVRSQVQLRLDRARALYDDAEFDDAIKQCDEALRIEPHNQEAHDLKNHISGTKEILNRKPSSRPIQ
jgi:hypothetical protein